MLVFVVVLVLVVRVRGDVWRFFQKLAVRISVSVMDPAMEDVVVIKGAAGIFSSIQFMRTVATVALRTVTRVRNKRPFGRFVDCSKCAKCNAAMK